MLLEIALALIFAKLFYMIFEKFKQPGVLGEIIAGIILGPCLIGSLSGACVTLFGTTMFTFELNLGSHEFEEIAFIGVIFLLFIVGLDTNTHDLKKSGKSGILTAFFGISLSFVFGYIIGFLLNMNITQSIAIGVIFVATSISLTIRLLSQSGLLSSKIGLTIHTADILNDISGIFILSFIVGAVNSYVLLLKIGLFFIVTLIIGMIIIKYASKWTSSRKAPVMILTAGFVICFLFAEFAEGMGIAAMIGAFIAGVIIRRTPQANVVIEYSEMIGQTFFTPLFFVWVGASFNYLLFMQLEGIGLFALAVFVFIAGAICAKVIGSFIGAKISGLNKRDSLLVGVGMIPRLGVALVVVSIEIEAGVFGDPAGILAQEIKMMTLLLVISTTFLTPFLFKRLIQPKFIRNIKRNKVKNASISFPLINDFNYFKKTYTKPLIAFFSKKTTDDFSKRKENNGYQPNKR